MKKQLLNIGVILSIIAITACNSTRKAHATYTTSKQTSTTQKSAIALPQEDGVIRGNWKHCNPNDDMCYMKHILDAVAKNFKYPKEARLNNYQGKVYIKIEWDEKGILDKNAITIVRSSGNDILDQAAKEVALFIPNLDTPATKNGKPVRSNYTLPIRYNMR